MRLSLFIAAAGVLVGCCSSSKPTAAPKRPEPYVRVANTTSNLVELQIALREFAPARRGQPSIHLVAVSHIGGSNYYAALQRHLAAHALVLFEGVGRAGSTGGSQNERPQAAPSDGKSLSSLQSTMAESLGLVFQLEAIDYDRPNFRNCDLSVPQLRKLIEEQHTASGQSSAGSSFETLLQTMQGGSLFDSLLQLGLRSLIASPKLQGLAKLALIDVLGQIQGDPAQIKGLPPDMKQLFDVLLVRRNQKIVDDLKSELGSRNRHGSVAVFYGAGHMTDLEQRLRDELGCRPTGQTWLTAFSVDLAKAGVSPGEREFMSGMIKRQLEVLRPQAATTTH
jgi:hypothetical protein